jgi:excisionase family DNA binding protein
MQLVTLKITDMMQTVNPFELIIMRLEQLQLSVDNIQRRTLEEASKRTADPERLLDLTEAAEIVRKPVGTVRHYIHHRNLPATKIGKSYLIKLNELLSWVDDFNKKAATSESVSNRMLENRKRYRKS